MKYLQNPLEVEATPWFKNGDHPHDAIEVLTTDDNEPYDSEGKIVRYFRDPMVPGANVCPLCQHTAHEHGFLDNGMNGEMVCPGDFIVTQPDGTYMAIRPEAFAAMYTPVVDPA